MYHMQGAKVYIIHMQVNVAARTVHSRSIQEEQLPHSSRNGMESPMSRRTSTTVARIIYIYYIYIIIGLFITDHYTAQVHGTCMHIFVKTMVL